MQRWQGLVIQACCGAREVNQCLLDAEGAARCQILLFIGHIPFKINQAHGPLCP